MRDAALAALVGLRALAGTGEALDTTVLVEQGGKTTLTLTVLYESREARDTAIRSNMEQGVAASYDRLAEVLAATLPRGDSPDGA